MSTPGVERRDPRTCDAVGDDNVAERAVMAFTHSKHPARWSVPPP